MTRKITKFATMLFLFDEYYYFSEPETSYEEDMQILRVIEAYCSLTSTSKQRHTFSTSSESKCNKLLHFSGYFFVKPHISKSALYQLTNIFLSLVFILLSPSPDLKTTTTRSRT